MAEPAVATWIINLLKSTPELQAIYDAAFDPLTGKPIKSVESITMEINASNWYLTNGPTVAAKIMARFSGGENNYSEGVNEQKLAVSKIATDLGLDASDSTISSYLAALSENAYLHNWSSSQIEGVIVSNPDVVKKVKGGVYAAQTQDIATYARLMGSTITDTDRVNYQQRLLGLADKTGIRVRSTVDDIKTEIRNKMAILYPIYSEPLKAGATMWDITSSYRQKWADLLERDPDSFTWDDPLWKDGKIFQSVGSDGKIVARPLWEVDKLIKADDRWQYTKNAGDVYDKYTYALGQKMGKI